MDPAAGGAPRGSSDEARLAIERFLAASEEPAILEAGDDPIPVTPEHYALEWRSGYLVLEAWTESRNLTRRITGILDERRDRLELAIERFAKRPGVLSLVDLKAPKSRDLGRRATRLTYREILRRSLARQYPAWRIAELSAEQDLEHSLSPSFPRAFLRKGTAGWAVIGAPPDCLDLNGVLTFGLIWLDYLRGRERKVVVEGLSLFLPAGALQVTCQRLHWLNARAAQFSVFAQSADGYEDPVDLRDHGNLDTRLEHCRRALPDQPERIREWVARLASPGFVECVPRGDGAISLRVRGLEFARAGDASLLYGMETKRPATASNLQEIEILAAELNRMRSPLAADRTNPLFLANPERWLESEVRRDVEEVDATLVQEPVYGQVPAFTAGDRDVIDLLAVDHSGRLAVIELKASEDIHLPLQALDYWMRVRAHADRGEFTKNGYFPSIHLRSEAPRLLLVAPALDFHPSNETVLRYFSPEIEVARVGVGLEWRKKLKVMFRHGN